MSVKNHRANMSRQKERVAFDVKDLMAGAEALLRSTAAYTGEEIEDARVKLQSQLQSAQEQAGQWNQLAKDRYREASDIADEYVHDHPWGLLGIVAALGVAAGLCLGSEKCRR
ncbi:DUF883 family protein [Paralcaligenes ureilyticus]|uniref:ElaB/YqjD/DUF883 family membrane-anchored ribosome-binding protein n=1 Tax=Paralcaligenes ureilyticus TaxID=627131 RepID=A0A4R3MBM5_9BURK|nr:DUF883 family protein [Paralcaligenes ureilyticus]TCT10163.1 ElaB/YqjD/DUF883 family membrane-anchored ribosome-binding protein [Paralcaligenes ureilyticus]